MSVLLILSHRYRSGDPGYSTYTSSMHASLSSDLTETYNTQNFIYLFFVNEYEFPSIQLTRSVPNWRFVLIRCSFTALRLLISTILRWLLNGNLHFRAHSQSVCRLSRLILRMRRVRILRSRRVTARPDLLRNVSIGRIESTLRTVTAN